VYREATYLGGIPGYIHPVVYQPVHPVVYQPVHTLYTPCTHPEVYTPPCLPTVVYTPPCLPTVVYTGIPPWVLRGIYRHASLGPERLERPPGSLREERLERPPGSLEEK